MKPRPPRSLAGAITKIRTTLSDDLCAQAVGRSTSLIRKWGDPDHRSSPNIAQAYALDQAFVDAGHGDPPIATLYRDLLEAALNTELPHTEDVRTAVLSVQAIVGDLSMAIRDAIREGGPERTVIGPGSRAAILEVLGRLDDGAEAIEDALDENEKGSG